MKLYCSMQLCKISSKWNFFAASLSHHCSAAVSNTQSTPCPPPCHPFPCRSHWGMHSSLLEPSWWSWTWVTTPLGQMVCVALRRCWRALPVIPCRNSSSITVAWALVVEGKGGLLTGDEVRARTWFQTSLHRITEWLGLKEIFGDHLAQLSCSEQPDQIVQGCI